MNKIMKEQFEAYPVSTAMVLGIAGGNGLEHVSRDKYRTVYGVDINGDYLRTVSERYKNLADILKCLKIDLIREYDRLPHAHRQQLSIHEGYGHETHLDLRRDACRP